MERSYVEKDLGIFLTSDLKWNYQATQAANRANMVLGQLKRAFKYWTINTFKQLYVAFVRPHLEYAVTAWCPYVKKDAKILEKVQRRATKLVHELKNLSYEQRLKKLSLTTLETRRKRGDLIEFYKIATGMSSVNWNNPNKWCRSMGNEGPAGGIRGHQLRLTKQITKCKQRENFFTNRIANEWRELPAHIVNSKSKDAFKNRIDKYLNLIQKNN